MKTALVTGATSGFGEAIALMLAKNKYRIVITGRRAERLDALKSRIEVEFGCAVHTLCFDVRDRQAVEQAYKSLPETFKPIDILINNAGLSLGFDAINTGKVDDWDNMIDTNVKGLLYMSNVVIPEMVARKSGHIVNIGSVAGTQVYPKGNVYCASKHAVDALSRGMRIDLMPHGIKVSTVNPGAAETEFSLVRFSGDAQKAKAVYAGYEPLVAQDIAETVEFVISRPAHVNINDILVMPLAEADVNNWHKVF